PGTNLGNRILVHARRASAAARRFDPGAGGVLVREADGPGLAERAAAEEPAGHGGELRDDLLLKSAAEEREAGIRGREPAQAAHAPRLRRDVANPRDVDEQERTRPALCEALEGVQDPRGVDLAHVAAEPD